MTAAGLPVPPGFVVAAHVLEQAVDAARLRELARAQDSGVGPGRSSGEAEPPRQAIADAYERLGGGHVAVRSSACAEDSETASFAGQQETYLHVERRRRGLRARRGVLGLLLHRARALLPGAQGIARRPRHGGGRPAHGRAGEVGRPLHRRPRPTATRPDGRRGRSSGSASRSSPAPSRPTTTSSTGQGAVKREQLQDGGVLTAAELARLAALGARARGALRRAAGHRVGDRRRRDLPAPVEAGDDPVNEELERRILAWIEPYWNAGHLVRTRDWVLELDPDASEALEIAALTHDMERHFPGGPHLDMSRQRPDDEEYNRAHSERSAADRRRVPARRRERTRSSSTRSSG